LSIFISASLSARRLLTRPSLRSVTLSSASGKEGYPNYFNAFALFGKLKEGANGPLFVNCDANILNLFDSKKRIIA